jgi:NhaP-type Na+/H+ or K+/H+ antiporter
VTPEHLDIAAAIIVCLAALPANLFPLVYSRRPWRASFLGRALMVKAVGIALLIDLSIVRLVLPEIPYYEILRLVVFAVVATGIWLQFMSLVRASNDRDLSDEHEHDQEVAP